MSLFQAASLHTKDQRQGVGEGGGGNGESGVTGLGCPDQRRTGDVAQ